MLAIIKSRRYFHKPAANEFYQAQRKPTAGRLEGLLKNDFTSSSFYHFPSLQRLHVSIRVPIKIRYPFRTTVIFATQWV